MAKIKPRDKPHYVNNKQFHAAMVEYKEQQKKAEAEGKEKPKIANYIGECFMKISVHLSHKPNFFNYTFKEEMICDGIENSLRYMDNFNPDKSNNPFAYFTQIIYFAFLRRIAKEKKYLYTKYKFTDELNATNMTADTQAQDNPASFNTAVKYSEWSQEYVSSFIKNYEDAKEHKEQQLKERKQDPSRPRETMWSRIQNAEKNRKNK